MYVEPIDDLPLLGDQLESCGLSSLLDEHFPDHGHWQGISGGSLAVGWMLYILSEGDHRLSHVEDWASLRINSLGAILGTPELRQLDFCDDRLARLLDRYSDDLTWQRFEQRLGKRLLEVYQLGRVGEAQDAPEVIRADSFNAPQYRELSELFTFGHNKQRRADQPFCKVMMASLDPLSLPLAVEIVKGGGTDADQYVPLIDRVRSTLSTSGNLYVGDSQLGSSSNRAKIHQGGDYYLCPLNRKQCSQAELDRYLDQIPDSIDHLSAIFTEQESKRKPAYFAQVTTSMSGEGMRWEERRILVYSPDYAKGLVNSFDNRLAEAQKAIELLVISKKGRRNPKTLNQLRTRIDRLVNKYKVHDYFEIKPSEERESYLVRKHKNRPEEIREKITLGVLVQRREEIIERKRRQIGWQIYATNAPEDRIETGELVKCYRNEYRIEHLFDYMINRDVGLLPIFLKKEHRVKALIRFLSLAIRFSTLLQYQVRQRLKQNKEKISGIYPGNKGRKTDQPTTPMLLRAFKGLAIGWVEIGKQTTIQMTPINVTQKIILELLGDSKVYQRIFQVLKTGPDLRET